MDTKTCTRCGEEKEISFFQIRKASKDGLTAACKGCLSKYEKNRANLPHRIEGRKKYQKTEAGIKSAKKAKTKWKEKNSFKRSVHIITGSAIRSGKIKKQPCEACGNKEVHAHHDDYLEPLNIRWLCPSCHRKWHKDNGEGKNSNPDKKISLTINSPVRRALGEV